MADVHTTMPSRRATLCGAVALASVAVTRRAKASRLKSSTIAALFARWTEAIERWPQISDEGLQTSEAFARIRPEVPAILREENVPMWWCEKLGIHPDWVTRGDLSRKKFPYARISKETIDMAVAGKYGDPDAWVRSAKSASDAFTQAEDEARRSSGLFANEEDGERLTDEISELSDQILALQPADISDIQRQVIVVQYEHFGVEVGRCDERLFANILAMPSTLKGGNANG